MKKAIQALLAKFGYSLYRRDVRFHPELCATRLANQLEIKTILDVGANVGQYGMALREWGFAGKILSFEPLSEAHRTLCLNASNDPEWQVAPRCAVGAATSRATINISANGVSSSLLAMLDTHSKIAPESAYVRQEETDVRSLDDLIAELDPDGGDYYLKIDTQGYERSVLDGASNVIGKCLAVQLEMSLLPLYRDGMLFDEALKFMRDHDFQLHAIYPGFSDRESGQTLQADGIFVKNRP